MKTSSKSSSLEKHNTTLSNLKEGIVEIVVTTINTKNVRLDEIVVLCIEIADIRWHNLLSHLKETVDLDWDSITENDDGDTIVCCVMPFSFCSDLQVNNQVMMEELYTSVDPGHVKILVFTDHCFSVGKMSITHSGHTLQ